MSSDHPRESFWRKNCSDDTVVVTFTIPAIAAGTYNVTVTASGGTVPSNAFPLNVLTGRQIPVTFTVDNVPLSAGASLYLTGNVFELGNNTLISAAPSVRSWRCREQAALFLDASVPSGKPIQFTFFQAMPNGSHDADSATLEPGLSSIGNPSA